MKVLYAVAEESADYAVLVFRRWIPLKLTVHLARLIGWRRDVSVRRSFYDRRLYVVGR